MPAARKAPPKFMQRIGKPAVRKAPGQKAATLRSRGAKDKMTAPRVAMGRMGGQLADETKRNTGARPSARAMERANPNASFKRAPGAPNAKIAKQPGVPRLVGGGMRNLGLEKPMPIKSTPRPAVRDLGLEKMPAVRTSGGGIRSESGSARRVMRSR